MLSVSSGSLSEDSTNCGLKILGKKFAESCKKRNLNVPCSTNNYLYCIYSYLNSINTVFHTIT